MGICSVGHSQAVDSLTLVVVVTLRGAPEAHLARMLYEEQHLLSIEPSWLVVCCCQHIVQHAAAAAGCLTSQATAQVAEPVGTLLRSPGASWRCLY